MRVVVGFGVCIHRAVGLRCKVALMQDVEVVMVEARWMGTMVSELDDAACEV